MLNYYSIGDSPNSPAPAFTTEIQFGDKVTWVKSRHVVKFGGDPARVRINMNNVSNTRGTFAFQDRWTNHPVGDVLLGLLNSTSRSYGQQMTYLRNQSVGAFLSDYWKVSRSLTLNLGLRYEFTSPAREKYGRMANFIPGPNLIALSNPHNIEGLDGLLQSTGLAARTASASDLGLPAPLVRSDYNNFAPRLGFAWRPGESSRLVVRGGYGIFYYGITLLPVRSRLMGAFPMVVSQTHTASPTASTW